MNGDFENDVVVNNNIGNVNNNAGNTLSYRLFIDEN